MRGMGSVFETGKPQNQKIFDSSRLHPNNGMELRERLGVISSNDLLIKHRRIDKLLGVSLSGRHLRGA